MSLDSDEEFGAEEQGRIADEVVAELFGNKSSELNYAFDKRRYNFFHGDEMAEARAETAMIGVPNYLVSEVAAYQEKADDSIKGVHSNGCFQVTGDKAFEAFLNLRERAKKVPLVELMKQNRGLHATKLRLEEDIRDRARAGRGFGSGDVYKALFYTNRAIAVLVAGGNGK